MVELFVCPRCRGSLVQTSPKQLFCQRDDLSFENVGGIWRFLLPESVAHYERFIRDYETVRQFEKRGSLDAEYYKALPYKDLTGKFSADWAIRAHSYDVLVNRVLIPLSARLRRPLKILDLGAGNGWLSNRLAAQGDHVVAVDLLVNTQDGLGTAKYYQNAFIPVQAEFNRLPIRENFADAAIFNASVHYSEDYVKTLSETLRVLQPEGLVVIIDSPIYHSHESGEKMVAERIGDFLRRFGFASDALQSENFLTYQRLNNLGMQLGINWKTIRPFYGLPWVLRLVKARLVSRREAAKFHVLVGTIR